MSRSRDIANLLNTVDAKGDILVGSADNSITKLTAGSTGQLPFVDSSAVSGLRYGDPPTNRNLIINGAMQIHQRGTSSAGITSTGVAYRTVDRFGFIVTSAGTWTHSVENDAPSGSGFRKSLKVLCTTANASPINTSDLRISTVLEGQDLQKIAKGTSSAQQLTMSFWVKSNITGTFAVWLFDNDNTRLASSTYTINTGATWERKTITFPADTIGILDNDNNDSLYISFALLQGSDYTSGTSQTSWGTYVGANRAVGHNVNLASAINNYWQITGIQLEAGSIATPFEFEPYERTLQRCQRYYYRMVAPAANYNIGVAYVQAATRARLMIDFPTTMRAAPGSIDTTGVAGDYSILNNGTTIVSCSAVPATNGPTVDLGALDWDVASGLTIGQACLVRLASSGSYIGWSAEL